MFGLEGDGDEDGEGEFFLAILLVVFDGAGVDFGPVAGFDFLELAGLAFLFVGGFDPGAVGEGAALGWVDGGGDVALEEDAAGLFFRVGAGDGGEEGLGVGVDGVVDDLVGGSELDDLAEVHDGDAVADVFYDSEVVSDEEVGEVAFALEVEEEVEDLALDGDVEGGDRFIADDEFRVEGEGAGDADALPLAAGKLKGKAVDGIGGEADDVEEFPDAFFPFVRVADLMDEEGFLEEVADGVPGVEGFGGVLKDHLEIPAEGFKAGAVEGGDVGTLEPDGAFGRAEEPDDAFPEGGLPATGFPDESEGFPCLKVKGDSVNGLADRFRGIEDPTLHGEMHAEVLDVKEGGHFRNQRKIILLVFLLIIILRISVFRWFLLNSNPEPIQ